MPTTCGCRPCSGWWSVSADKPAYFFPRNRLLDLGLAAKADQSSGDTRIVEQKAQGALDHGLLRTGADKIKTFWVLGDDAPALLGLGEMQKGLSRRSFFISLKAVP